MKERWPKTKRGTLGVMLWWCFLLFLWSFNIIYGQAWYWDALEIPLSILATILICKYYNRLRDWS